MSTYVLYVLTRLCGITVTIAFLANTQTLAWSADTEAHVSFVEAAQHSDSSPIVTAIGLRMKPIRQPVAASEIVILVDTSASQAGDYRRLALDSLAGILEKARETDRFQIAAVDISCVPLSDGFLSPRGESIRASTLKLDARTPLGSTDMITVLDAAAELFSETDSPRSMIYIGDGPGLTGIATDDFQRVVDMLRSKRISFSSLCVGPQINWPCLAAIASASGGVLMAPGDAVSAKDAGSALIAMATSPISWPEEVVLSTDAPDPRLRMLPGRLPPLRSDRDSIILIEGQLSAARLEMQLECGSTKSPLALDIPAATPQTENAFLTELARNASDSDGVFLPLLGREGFEMAKAAIRGEATALAELSRQAESVGAHDSAVRLAEASLRRDPDNADASLMRSVAQSVPRTTEVEVNEFDNESASSPDAQPSELEQINTLRKIRGQQLEQEIAVKLREARQLMASDPDQAKIDLKDTQRLLASDDLDPVLRDRLNRQIEISVRESALRSQDKKGRDLAAEQRAASGRERLKLLDKLQREEDRIKQLTVRYNTLVEEGMRTGYQQPTTSFHDAERVVGKEIAEAAPDPHANQGIPMTARILGRTAPLVARILDYDTENARVRRDSQRGFMDALHLTDVAHIPFPDEPPIEYPSPKRWAELTKKREKYKSVDLDKAGSAEKKIFDALDKKVESFEFTETPIRDVIAQIEDAQGIPVEIDMKALEDAGFDLETPLTKSISGISLRSALRLLLGDLDLAYIIKDEVMLITTKEKAAEHIVIKVYPVADLVLPVNPSSGINPFQMGGGMGGQQGGMGGGMGGQQGGMGGQHGGGMFQISDARALVARREKPDLAPVPARVATPRQPTAAPRKAPPTAAIPPATVAAPAASELQTDAVGLSKQIVEAADLQTAIRDYLDAPSIASGGNSKQGPIKDQGTPPTEREMAIRMSRLRVSAAELGRSDRFDRAADLISAAIISGHCEPWMYEALAVAMEAAGRPREDVDRVLLSSADSATTPSDLLLLANYLARSGSTKQAIRICKQVTILDRSNREAFALAMVLAASGEDVGTLLWACPGVLRHQWPASQQEVVTRATRLSKVTIEKLGKEGQAETALAFQAAIDTAIIRDIDLQITWGGDADIDLIVEEPTGTVCSLSSPRSSSGGTLLGDTAAATVSAKQPGAGGDPTNALQRERYVAAEAFPGTYRVLIRRAFGKVAADTITAELTLYKGTDREQKLRRQLPLGADEVLLSIDLPEGRRRESLLDAQVAQDVVVQQQLGRSILAQQLNGLSDSSTLASLSQSRAGGTAGQGIPGQPFFRGGAVGYQPVVSMLPEGANFFARAVVSADRRYVRVTSTPLFSGVGQVTQFSSSGGGQQGGQQAGQQAGQQVGGQQGGQQGGMQGGQQGQFCWVAREVYGDYNPKWLLFRHWLQTSAPRWLHDLYASHGQEFALWIHDKPLLKSGIRLLMDQAISPCLPLE